MVGILIGVGSFPSISYEPEPVQEIKEVKEVVVLSVKEKVEQVFFDAPEMVRIAGCESGYRHLKPDGEVLVSPTGDYGVMQINAASHQKRMEELGLDIRDIDDNLAYARKLYDEQGSSPWVCARKLSLN